MNHTVSKSIPDEIKYLAEIIQNAGYKFYIVGGFVRDIFIGSCDAYENDIDVCGDCAPDAFAELISNDSKIKLCEANYPLGTLKLVINKIDIEYTCFRKESYRGDGFHTPSEIVFTNDIFLDASRRDFSINALYLDPVTLEITDFFDGRSDISNKIIKTVRNSEEIFKEDALRIIRMCRFSAKLGFDIETNTMIGAQNCAHLLNNISKERIGVELDKIVWDTEYPKFGLEAIYSSHIDKFICKNVSKDTAIKITTADKDRYIRWAVFLSDLSPKEAQRFVLNLSLGKVLAKEVSKLLADKGISNQTENSIILHFAKIGKKAAQRQVSYNYAVNIDNSAYLEDIFKSMTERKQFINYNELALTGNDIMYILSVKGKEIKVIKDKIYEYAVLNPQKNTYDDLKSFLLNKIN